MRSTCMIANLSFAFYQVLVRANIVWAIPFFLYLYILYMHTVVSPYTYAVYAHVSTRTCVCSCAYLRGYISILLAYVSVYICIIYIDLTYPPSESRHIAKWPAARIQ